MGERKSPQFEAEVGEQCESHMGKLTAKLVENLSVEGKYEDGEGLRLVVKGNGRKSWVLRFQIQGKRREMGLGGFPSVGLKEARINASALRAQVLEGIDPLDVIQKAKQERSSEQQKITPSFKMLCSDYIEAHRPSWKSTRHAAQWEATLATYAEPVIGDLSAADVTTAHILTILRPMWRDKTETAVRLRNRIELVLDSAKAQGLRDGENPARWRGHLDKLLPSPNKVRKREHMPALPWADMPAFWQTLKTHRERSYVALKFVILTATRTSEVLNATWDEFDMDTGTWTIPAQRMKGNREHRVPLSQEALEILKSTTTETGSNFIFPGLRSPQKPLSNMSMLMALRRMGREDLTTHGFRSTFRDWAAENTHHPREVIELCLSHVVAGSTESAYWRSDLLDKRRVLLDEWTNYISNAPDNSEASGSHK
jgi:integrase